MKINNEYRLNYYLNGLCEDDTKLSFDVSYKMTEFNYDKICVGNYKLFKDNIHSNDYFKDMEEYLSQLPNYHNKNIFYRFGDHFEVCQYPTFVKVRKYNNTNPNNIILNLDSNRHSGMLDDIQNNDIPFKDKNNKIIWRGCSTGEHIHGMRGLIVKKYQHSSNKNIDIKYNLLVQGVTNCNNEYILGDSKSYKELLQSKFLISIEGNDVASNLKWILFSNSVVLMPIPKICSWFMEDHLEPFVHFVPLNDDLNDLEEKYEWCLNNLDKCEEISKNATEYMLQFMDKANEKKIVNSILEKYFNKVSIHLQ